jgi:Flp pilus assembly protein TadG
MPVKTRNLGRRGAAVVEFAILLPFLVFLVLGALEFGRALMVVEALNDAARRGCRSGVQGSATTASITQDAKDSITDTPLNAAVTVIVAVNGDSTKDAKTSVRGDQISVQVTVPDNSVYWTPYLFLRGYTLRSQAVVMMRQQ